MVRALAATIASAIGVAAVHADAANQCHLIDVELTPSDNLQIVAWIEKPDGTYVDTIYITQQVGRFGIGNRPGRYDFNSGPLWPYGRRVTVLPVWSHKKTPLTFPEVIFQNAPDDPDSCATMMNTPTNSYYSLCGENNLSHQVSQSSPESHFCQPLMANTDAWTTTADTLTCATPGGSQGSGPYTDKGHFSSSKQSFYPPRADLVRNVNSDSTDVTQFAGLDPFDAISQATPVAGTDTHLTCLLYTSDAADE